MPAGLSLTMAVLLGVTPSATCRAPTPAGSADYLLMRLRLHVEVRSPEGRPSPNVTVRFVDTAPPPGERGEGRVVGTTDEQGVVDTVVFQKWPDYFRQDRRPDAGTFDIVLANQAFHAAVECLPQQGGEHRMSISVVATSDAIIITDAGSSEERTRPPNNAMQLTRGGWTRVETCSSATRSS
jgi:hypothetical protein